MKDWLCETCMHNGKKSDVCIDCEPQDPIRSEYSSARNQYKSIRAQSGKADLDTRVQCPFYNMARVKYRMISCEGPEEGTTLALFFTRKEYTRDYIEARCEGEYKRCRLYRMLNKEYQAGE